LALLISGCAALTPTADPSRFYTLSLQTEEEASIPYNNSNVIVMPVLLPAYLDRLQIIQKNSRHEIIFSEYDRWGEPLSEGTTQAIRESLSSLLGANYIRQFPYQGDRSHGRNFYLRTSFSAFEGDTVEKVSLKVTWRITDYRDVKVFTYGKSDIALKTDAKDYYQIATTMSKALSEFSLEVAQALAALEN